MPVFNYDKKSGRKLSPEQKGLLEYVMTGSKPLKEVKTHFSKATINSLAKKGMIKVKGYRVKGK